MQSRAPQPISLSPPHATPLPPLLPSPPRPPPPPTLKCLTPEEIASCRERGLCFNCDEKCHRGHRYASWVFLLIAEDEDPTISHIGPNDSIPDPPDGPDSCPAQISLNSLAGHLASKTLRLVGTITGYSVILLVDSGSTHNFIQQQLVTQLGLPCWKTTPLRVMVGNGQQLECNCFCEAVTIDIQTTPFTVDLYVLPIAGANVVLGV